MKFPSGMTMNLPHVRVMTKGQSWRPADGLDRSPPIFAPSKGTSPGLRVRPVSEGRRERNYYPAPLRPCWRVLGTSLGAFGLQSKRQHDRCGCIGRAGHQTVNTKYRCSESCYAARKEMPTPSPTVLEL